MSSTILVTVTLRGPIPIVLALWAHDLGHLDLHQLMHDGQAEPDRQREQTLPRCPDELAECLLNLCRQRQLRRLHGRDDLGAGYLLHGGPPVLTDLVWRPRTLPTGADEAGRTASNFYELPDNLVRSPGGATIPSRACAFSDDPRAWWCSLGWFSV